MCSSKFIKDSPTSSINNYIKTFSKDSTSTNDIFNPVQRQLGDTTDSIKRYLEKLLVGYPVLGGILYKDVVYDTPGQVLLLKHKLGRPYSGLNIVSLTAPRHYQLTCSKSTPQLILVGSSSAISWATTAQDDPFSSLTAPTNVVAPFNSICDITVTLYREYNFPIVGLLNNFDDFFVKNNTTAQTIATKSLFVRGTSADDVSDNETITILNQSIDKGSSYSVFFTNFSADQSITNTSNVTRLQIEENKSANPRIDSTSDAQMTKEDKAIFIPIVSDKACKFSCVVYA